MASARDSSRRLRSRSESLPAGRLAWVSNPVFFEDFRAFIDQLGFRPVLAKGSGGKKILEDRHIFKGLRNLESTSNPGLRALHCRGRCHVGAIKFDAA